MSSVLVGLVSSHIPLVAVVGYMPTGYELHEGTAQFRPFEPNKKVVLSVLSRVIFIRC